MNGETIGDTRIVEPTGDHVIVSISGGSLLESLDSQHNTHSALCALSNLFLSVAARSR